MASFLKDFVAQVDGYVTEMEEMEKRNKQIRFKPTFWLANEDFTVAREVFLAAGGSINHEITKFSLVYSKTPTEEEASSICEAIATPCAQLFSATKVALFCGVGHALASEVIHKALHVFKTVRDLAHGIDARELKRVPQWTGMVWEACSSLVHLPKSNCIATKRKMLQCISVLNDTMKELEECLEEDQESLTQVEDEDEFAFDSHVSSEEKQLFQANCKLLKMVLAILKRGVLSVKQMSQETAVDTTTTTTTTTTDELIAWTALLDQRYDQMQESIVEFGASVFPPIDTEELGPQLAALEKAALACLQTLADKPDTTDKDRTELAKGRTAFQNQMSQVKRLMALEP